jgi:hypothetical protein
MYTVQITSPGTDDQARVVIEYCGTIQISTPLSLIAVAYEVAYALVGRPNVVSAATITMSGNVVANPLSHGFVVDNESAAIEVPFEPEPGQRYWYVWTSSIGDVYLTDDRWEDTISHWDRLKKHTLLRTREEAIAKRRISWRPRRSDGRECHPGN